MASLSFGFGLVGLVLAQDTTFNSDVTIDLDNPNINIIIKSGSVATSVVVNPGSIVLTLPPGGNNQITLESPSRELTFSGQTATLSETHSCSQNNVFTITFVPGANPETITVTPTNSPCQPPSGTGGGGEGAPPVSTPPSTTTGQVITSASLGGSTTAFFPDGSSLKVDVPPNATSQNAKVTVYQVKSSLAPAVQIASKPASKAKLVGDKVYNITITTIAGSPISLNKAVTIVITYTDSQIAGLDEDTLKIYRWTGTAWEVLATVVDKVNNKLTATTSAFSTFAVFGYSPSQVQVTPEVSPRVPEIHKPSIQLKAQLLAQIQKLLQQILTLNQKIVALGGKPVEIPPGLLRPKPTPSLAKAYVFNRDLKFGLRSASVRDLQTVLSTMPDIYPEGQITGYFGPLTLAAVKRFQTKYGIPATGFVGPLTRAKLNQLFGQISQ